MPKSLNVHDAVFSDLRRWRSGKCLTNPVERTTNREDELNGSEANKVSTGDVILL
jgi:hypothetical protein